MNALISILIVSLLCLSSCNADPSEDATQIATSEIQSVQNTPTPLSTSTPEPTIDPCPRDQAEQFREDVYEIYQRFMEVSESLAITLTSTQEVTREQMRDIRNEADALSFPPCGDAVHKSLLTFMDSGLEWADVFITDRESAECDLKEQVMVDNLWILANKVAEFDKAGGFNTELYDD